MRKIYIYPALILVVATRLLGPEIPPVAAVRSLAEGVAGGLAYLVDRPRRPSYSLGVPVRYLFPLLDASSPRFRLGYLPPEPACRSTRQVRGLERDKHES